MRYNIVYNLAAVIPTIAGQFSLPVRCLKEPSPPRLVHPVTAQFVKELKKEMLENPTSDVAPMIGLVFLIDGEQFDQQHPEAYSYEVIGGNNSRKALQELIEEHPHLASEKPYCQWPVSVYSNLTDEQAQHLAIKHNRATHFTHAMTTQDKVRISHPNSYVCMYSITYVYTQLTPIHNIACHNIIFIFTDYFSCRLPCVGRSCISLRVKSLQWMRHQRGPQNGG